MTAQATLSINDGQATPVAHSFDPRGARTGADRKNVAVWRDASATSLVGMPTLTETYTPVNSNGMEKFRYVIDVPTTQTPSGGVPERAYGTIAVVEVWAHQSASLQELKNIAAYVKNFTASTYFTNAVQNRDAAW